MGRFHHLNKNALAFIIVLTVAVTSGQYGALACGGGGSGGESGGSSESGGSDEGTGHDSARDDPVTPPAGFVPSLNLSGFGNSTTGSNQKSNVQDLVKTVNRIDGFAPPRLSMKPSDIDKRMARAQKVQQYYRYLQEARQAEKNAAYWTKMKKAAEAVKAGAEFTNFVLGFFVPVGKAATVARSISKFEKIGTASVIGLKGVEGYVSSKFNGHSTARSLANAAVASTLSAVMDPVVGASVNKAHEQVGKAVTKAMISQSMKAKSVTAGVLNGIVSGGIRGIAGKVENSINDKVRE